jgi:hypothetical protein
MKFIHEFDPHGWKTYHRLVWINPQGERIAGDWALYEAPAFFSVKHIAGEAETDMFPDVGYFALTDYFTGSGSRVSAYSSRTLAIEVTQHEFTKEEHAEAQAAEGEADDDTFALAP